LSQKRSDLDELSQNITICGNRLAYTINYLCLKYRVGGGKKRSTGSNQDNLIQGFSTFWYSRTPKSVL
jgi:hypothetical protein